MPMYAAGAAALANFGAGLIKGGTGSGKNRRSANFFYDPTGQRGTGHNVNAANWGGREGGADQDANRMRSAAEWGQTRQAEKVNYDAANNWQNYSSSARGQQQQIAGMMQNRASGAVPSIAGQQAAVDTQRLQQQAANDTRRVVAQQASAAASARGAAGLALAGQTAANNTATAQSAINQQTAQGIQNITNQAQVNAANERLQAENAAMGAYSNIRGGDLQNQQQAAQQTQYQAGVNAQQRQANDQFSLGLTGQEMGVKQSQLNAKMQEQNILATSYNQSEQLNQQTAQANANNERSLWDSVFSDERTKSALPMAMLMAGGAPSKNDDSGGGDVFAQAGKSSGDKSSGADFTSMFGMMGGSGAGGAAAGSGAAGASGAGAGAAAMGSDTRTKQQALLEKGRVQGVALARGGRVSRDDVNAIKYGSWSADADSAALDDRARQNETGPETVGRAGLNSAIEAQIAQDERARPQATRDQAILARGGRSGTNYDDPIRDDAARAQWERSFGSAAAAADDVRTTDNLNEARKIREGFGSDQLKQPSTGESIAMLLSGLGGKGQASQPQGQPWLVTKPGGLFDSDERAKQAAFKAGWNEAQNSGGADYNDVYDDREPREADVEGAQDLKVRGTKYASKKAAPTPDAPYAPLPPPVQRRSPVEFERTTEAHEAPYERGLSLAEQAAFDDASRGAFPEDQARAYAERYQAAPVLARGRKSTGATHAAPGRKHSMGSDERTKNTAPDDGPIADANRAMRGEPYTYRPGFTPPNERPGQPHFGFMAQNLERNPVSSVAVERGPDGMRRVDRDRMLQVVAAGVADLQRQQDETRLALRAGGKRKRP